MPIKGIYQQHVVCPWQVAERWRKADFVEVFQTAAERS
jgi:hypothetical protein